MSDKNQSYTLITMTLGMTMSKWKSVGLISRELGYYLVLSRCIGKLGFLTYGNRLEEQAYLRQYIPDASVVWNLPGFICPLPCGLIAASFLPPLIKKQFQGCKLIRSNQFNGSWGGALLAKRLKVPFILRCGYLHSQHYIKKHPKAKLKQLFYILMEKQTAKMAQGLIVTYPGAKEFFIQKYGIPEDKIHILGNPVDTNLFQPIQNSKKKDVICVSRLTKQKNLYSLITACALAGKSLTLVGEGQLKESLNRYAAKEKADVNFIGFIPNTQLPMVFAAHRLFILPSFYEGNPKVLIEAMSSGMPCIASKIPENENLINHEREGLLCGLSPNEIADSIERLSSDIQLSTKLAKNAREKIVNEYSIEKIAERESQIHRNLL